MVASVYAKARNAASSSTAVIVKIRMKSITITRDNSRRNEIRNLDNLFDHSA
jgi:hypothetical protein